MTDTTFGIIGRLARLFMKPAPADVQGDLVVRHEPKYLLVGVQVSDIGNRGVTGERWLAK